MTLNWFTSKTVREATAMRKHVQKLLDHQRDILSPKAVSEVEATLKDIRDTIAAGADKATLEKKMENLEETANKWIKPYPNSAWRENIEVLLVALAVAMGIRTFFLQPFKIPTASMQPTLYGITSKNLRVETDYQRPTGWGRVKDWLGGATYLSYKADQDGTFDGVSKPLRFLIFNIKQTLWFGGKPHSFWFVPDTGGGMPLEAGLAQTIGLMFTPLQPASQDPREMSDLEGRMGIPRGTTFHKGDEVLNLKIVSGDHLFIDRVTYNFLSPGRGDIVVFETKGIPEEQRNRFGIPANEFYIKRLVGLGGETLSLQQDYMITDVPGPGGMPMDVPAGHLVVNGHPLSASTPSFKGLYSFSNPPAGTKTIKYQPNHYYGHGMLQDLEPGRDFSVRPDYFFVMGDNTMNSLDSRYWGDFPQDKVIGKAFFVYWPINARFGWGYLKP
ncbi:MAG TPA: signal peptidase I [Verrucomicrobiae bacterium]|jgi:signal peptidase I|nr:signal peptidase I [Verrucomicrobiae bacterium]